MTDIEILFVTLWLVVGTTMAVRLYGNLGAAQDSGRNNDDTVVDLVVYLLRHAQSELIMHDDGDKVDNSIYDDDSVVSAMRHRLAENPELRIRMYFNRNPRDLKVYALATEHPDRVGIRYRPTETRPVPDIHYRIVDGGMIGHLSRHKPGSGDREYEFFNCSRAPKRIRDRVLKPYCDKFEEDFAAASPAA